VKKRSTPNRKEGTIILRGTSRANLTLVKKIFQFCLFTANHLQFETFFVLDITADLVEKKWVSPLLESTNRVGSRIRGKERKTEVTPQIEKYERGDIHDSLKESMRESDVEEVKVERELNDSMRSGETEKKSDDDRNGPLILCLSPSVWWSDHFRLAKGGSVAEKEKKTKMFLQSEGKGDLSKVSREVDTPTDLPQPELSIEDANALCDESETQTEFDEEQKRFDFGQRTRVDEETKLSIHLPPSCLAPTFHMSNRYVVQPSLLGGNYDQFSSPLIDYSTVFRYNNLQVRNVCGVG
jgi:hypothetical protein